MDTHVPKVLAFDLDGTLTQHKSPLSSECRELLLRSREKYRLLMVGAGSCRRIFTQMESFPIQIIGNYGMQFADVEQEASEMALILHSDRKVEVDSELAAARANALRQMLGYLPYKGETIEIHERGMLTFPRLGTEASIADKLAYDPDRVKRRKVYAQVKDMFPEYKVYIGGSSSFDIVPHPYTKLHALDLYCTQNQFSHEDVLYFGDDYGLGGNDEDVYLSDIPFQCIDDYHDTLGYLERLL